MVATKYDVVAIGNAIVDVLAHIDDNFIEQQSKDHGMQKGAMTLVEQDRSNSLYQSITAALEMSGGSAANSLSILAGLGGEAGFIGKVADDKLGDFFINQLRESGVTFETERLISGASTARCIILVSEDAQRTMNTYLGASTEIKTHDINVDMIASSRLVYLEGYLFDKECAKKAFRCASSIARQHGKEVALTLSDPLCVERHREDFIDLIDNHVDIVFANEEEIMKLYQVDSFEQARDIVHGKCKVIALTRGEKGSIILTPNESIIVDAVSPSELVDTTGAGDAYAGGFLYGYTNGLSLYESAQLGTMMATEIISQMGPRTEQDLSVFINDIKKAA